MKYEESLMFKVGDCLDKLFNVFPYDSELSVEAVVNRGFFNSAGDGFYSNIANHLLPESKPDYNKIKELTYQHPLGKIVLKVKE